MQVQPIVLLEAQEWLTDTDATDTFRSERQPSISYSDYVERICRYIKPSVEVAFFASEAMRRMTLRGYSALSLHRLCLACVLVARKWHDDECATRGCNAYMAKVGGIEAKELAELESAVLKELDWCLYEIDNACSDELAQLHTLMLCA